MKILIVGSIYHHEDHESRDKFRDACRQIGAAVTQAGHQLIVGSDGPQTADRYVVDGAAATSKKPRIWAYRADGQQPPFAGEKELQQKTDIHYRELRGQWRAGRVPQVLAADVVVLIGGGRGTSTAGHVGAALERPVIVVGAFGGAAAELWEELEDYYDVLPDVAENLARLRHAWPEDGGDIVVESAIGLLKSGAFSARSNRPLATLLAGQLALLTAWVFLFQNPGDTQGAWTITYTFFSMMGIAAFLGTALRTNLRLVFDRSIELSWGQLLTDASAGILLAFGITIIYLLGGFTVTGGADEVLLPGTTGDFQRVAVVMTLLGLTGGLLIEQVAERLRAWLVDKLGSTS